MSGKYTVYQIDAFTSEPFSGNPAGVVPDASGLTEADMLKIAKELNNSETAFVFPGDGETCDIHVRFFTPKQEVPVCGHATVGTNYTLALLGNYGDVTNIRQKCGAGILPIEVRREDGDYRVYMTQGAFKLEDVPPADVIAKVLDALHLTAEDLRPDCPVQVATTGAGKLNIGIRDKAKLDALAPNLEQLTALSREYGFKGYFVFTLDAASDPAVNGRMFNPAAGIPEDPVTGNAYGPLGGYLAVHHLLPVKDGVLSFRGIQGEAMGRRGEIGVIVDLSADGSPERIRITGKAAEAFHTEITI